MNPLKKLGQFYLRWRHSKGYGVHSPFAFSIVENVISLNSNKYSYYNYRVIKNELKKKRISYEESLVLGFLLRLLSFLNVSLIEIECEETEAFIDLLTNGFGLKVSLTGNHNSAQSIIENKNDEISGLVLTSGEMLDDKKLAEIIKRNLIIFVDNPTNNFREKVEKLSSEGVLFSDKGKALFIPRNEMHYICYECRLIK